VDGDADLALDQLEVGVALAVEGDGDAVVVEDEAVFDVRGGASRRRGSGLDGVAYVNSSFYLFSTLERE
jgi:hypothetical protein